MRNWNGYILRVVPVVAILALQVSAGRSQNNVYHVGATTASSPPANEVVLPGSQEIPQATRRLRVSLAGSKLTIVADNSSLGEIMRKVGEVNGMEITGAVPAEPVFGTYGPDEVSAVISSLLQGTDTNVLFSQGYNHLSQLVLTPRTGLPSSPTKQAIASSNLMAPRPDGRGASYGHRPAELPERTQESKQQPGEPSGAPATTAAVEGPKWTKERSPNGIKTPCEMREQLMKRGQPLEGVLSSHQGSLDPCR